MAAKYGGYCLSTAYSHVTAKLRWRCAHGHEWERSAAKVRNGEWCAICVKRGRQSVALEEMCALATERGGECLSDAFEGNRYPLRWRCEDGHEWDAAPSNIKRGRWCPRCAYINRRHTIGKMKAIALERGGRCLSDSYINVATKLQWECSRGHVWFTTPMGVLAGNWCPVCKYMDQCVTDEARRKYLDTETRT
ncbi:zinc-ribbon domain-containing protein [Paraburkholderia piptadeniae]|nr:hypothetical protein [Paraburkholderia piptadeniae]